MPAVGSALGRRSGPPVALAGDPLPVRAVASSAPSLRHGPGWSTVSHHLRVLIDAGLVSRLRSGTSVNYRRTELGRLLVGGTGVSARAPG